MQNIIDNLKELGWTLNFDSKQRILNTALIDYDKKIAIIKLPDFYEKEIVERLMKNVLLKVHGLYEYSLCYGETFFIDKETSYNYYFTIDKLE